MFPARELFLRQCAAKNSMGGKIFSRFPTSAQGSDNHLGTVIHGRLKRRLLCALPDRFCNRA